MYIMSKRSRNNLAGVHPKLVECVEEALRITEQDFTVVEGVRTIEKQREYFKKGASKTMNSRHLKQPDGFGHAVDLYPYYDGSVQVDAPFSRFKAIKDAMFAAAKKVGCKLTWGADWDRDGDSNDERFVDSPHYQIEL